MISVGICDACRSGRAREVWSLGLLTKGRNSKSFPQCTRTQKGPPLRSGCPRKTLDFRGRQSTFTHPEYPQFPSDLCDPVDVLGRPRTPLDGGPWAIQTVPPILVRVKLK